jgi:hypothetical protein
MKVEKIIKQMYKAIIAGDAAEERRLWHKALKKSLKKKKTHVIK